MKLITLLMILPIQVWSQQIADTSYRPEIRHPQYAPGKGPVVFIDEGHHNFHTRDGRYLPFSQLLERDGYRVEAYTGLFETEKLKRGKILVISNALNEINVQNWFLPTPSAFTADEINKVADWVQNGGSLFLIADHMPMAGAAADLAGAFGFGFTNGFVSHDSTQGTAWFRLHDQSLGDNTITNGRNAGEKVSQIVTFTGQAFQIPDDAVSILTFDEHYKNLLPDTAWVFSDKTVTHNVNGWSQGAFKTFGKGRVVVFGEAALFSAQLAGPGRKKTGMNHPDASQNYRLLLNIVHWLDGLY